jgi:phage-related protein
MLRRILCGTAVAALALTVAGCSSDSSSSSTTTSAQTAVCKDKGALEDSVKSLTNLDLATAGSGKIKSDAQDVQDNLDALGKSVKSSLKPEVDALKSAVQQLEDAVKSFGDQSISQSLQDTGSAISKVGSTSSDLAKKLNDQCPS